MVFFSETKKSKLEMENVVAQLGEYCGTFFDAKGRSRGLVLLWEKKKLILIYFHTCHVTLALP